MSNGNIVQCIGAVVDIKFPRDAMPKKRRKKKNQKIEKKKRKKEIGRAHV